MSDKPETEFNRYYEKPLDKIEKINYCFFVFFLQ